MSAIISVPSRLGSAFLFLISRISRRVMHACILSFVGPLPWTFFLPWDPLFSWECACMRIHFRYRYIEAVHMHSMSPPELYNCFSISMHRRIVQSKIYIYTVSIQHIPMSLPSKQWHASVHMVIDHLMRQPQSSCHQSKCSERCRIPMHATIIKSVQVFTIYIY